MVNLLFLTRPLQLYGHHEAVDIGERHRVAQAIVVGPYADGDGYAQIARVVESRGLQQVDGELRRFPLAHVEELAVRRADIGVVTGRGGDVPTQLQHGDARFDAAADREAFRLVRYDRTDRHVPLLSVGGSERDSVGVQFHGLRRCGVGGEGGESRE